MSPIVSVIIPAYNAAKYLAETVDSVINQSFDDIEILIIDDGSTDNTLEIANQYQRHDHRIRVISQSNQGVSATRNNGVAHSKGKYIAFLDADDLWLYNKLKCHLEHFNDNRNLAVSFGRVCFLDPDGEVTNNFSKPVRSHLKPYHFFYENPTITSSNLVIRREVFDQIGFFDESMSYSEDQEWCLRVLSSEHWQVEGMNQVLMYYRTTNGGLSSHLHRMEEGWEMLASKARTIFPDLATKHYSKARATYLRYLARKAIRLRLSPHVATDFINRSLCTDWRIIITEPGRTIPTLILAYTRYVLKRLNFSHYILEDLKHYKRTL
jgi:glycosyltransferase involved in cell wall biosynthesis